MSYYRIDSAFGPTLEQAKAFATDGIKEYGLYVSGARVYHASSKQDFDVLRAAGLKPVFIHTGWDGNEAVQGARACGAVPGDKVALDVEAGWNDNYSQDWAHTVKGAGFKTELYGLDSEIGAHGQVFDDTWVARYTYPQVPVPLANQAIQYENSHVEHGVNVDKSISNEDAAPPAPAITEGPYSMNLKRALIMLTRFSVFETWPLSQAEIDSYASSLADDLSNYEAVVTDMENTWVKNGGKPIGAN